MVDQPNSSSVVSPMAFPAEYLVLKQRCQTSDANVCIFNLALSVLLCIAIHCSL